MVGAIVVITGQSGTVVFPCDDLGPCKVPLSVPPAMVVNVTPQYTTNPLTDVTLENKSRIPECVHKNT